MNASDIGLTRFVARDSYGSEISLTYRPDDGAHSAAIFVEIAHLNGARTDVQFIGEGGIARILGDLSSFVESVRA